MYNAVEMLNRMLMFYCCVQCSVDCGRGERQRDVYCVDSRGNRVADTECRGRRPRDRRTCIVKYGCGQWVTGKWDKVIQSCFVILASVHGPVLVSVYQSVRRTVVLEFVNVPLNVLHAMDLSPRLVTRVPNLQTVDRVVRK